MREGKVSADGMCQIRRCLDVARRKPEKEPVAMVGEKYETLD